LKKKLPKGGFFFCPQNFEDEKSHNKYDKTSDWETG